MPRLSRSSPGWRLRAHAKFANVVKAGTAIPGALSRHESKWAEAAWGFQFKIKLGIWETLTWTSSQLSHTDARERFRSMDRTCIPGHFDRWALKRFLPSSGSHQSEFPKSEPPTEIPWYRTHLYGSVGNFLQEGVLQLFQVRRLLGTYREYIYLLSDVVEYRN